MIGLRDGLQVVVVLSTLFKSSQSIPNPEASNAAALFQATNAVPFPHPSASTASASPSSNGNQAHFLADYTYIVLSKQSDGRVMPFAETSRLLYEAGADIQRKVVQHGADTPLVDDYKYVHGKLYLEAWQDISEVETKVTYDMVRNMVRALESNLWQLDDVECDVALSRLVRGVAQPGGHGLIGFYDNTSTNGRNSTITSIINGSNGTARALGADSWEYPIGDTLFNIQKLTHGRRMPILESLQLLDEADRDLDSQIEQRGDDTPIEGGEYFYLFGGLRLAARQYVGARVPVTYDTVKDMVTALKDCFWRVNYVESTLKISRISSRSLLTSGAGSISFQDILNRTNSSVSTFSSAARNRTLPGPGNPGSSLDTA
ncbi:MAG: hypothetical protein Q9191_001445 [Dirinaria sp. TL-2023a]